MKPAAPSLLTVTEVAAILRLTPKGVYSMVAARTIPCIRVSNRIRFDHADVIAWLKQNRVPAQEES